MTIPVALDVLKSMLLTYFDGSALYFSALNIFEQKKMQILQNIAIRVCLLIKDPTSVHVEDMHKRANIVPIDIRRSYLQELLCYRLIDIDSV